MRLWLPLGSAVAALGLVAAAAVVLDLSFERAVLLAPVIVVSAGAVVGLAVLWGKAALEPFRRRPPPA